jgi:hypothetical protein
MLRLAGNRGRNLDRIKLEVLAALLAIEEG